MRVCILEDDHAFALRIERQVTAFLTGEDVPCLVEHCSTPDEVMGLPGRPPDLLIADIDLGPGVPDGIEAARRLQGRVPYCQVIYITGYLSFATEVYATNHVCFILKDELDRRLNAALDRVLEELFTVDDRLLLTRKDSQLLLEQQDILYCEQTGRKTSVLSLLGEFSVYESVSDLTCRVDPARFVQCHRSFLVNLRYVSRLTYQAITLPGGLQIPVSRTRYPAVKTAFTRYAARNLMLPRGAPGGATRL